MQQPLSTNPMRPQDKVRELINFANTFARYPRRIGALVPSSQALAKAMVSKLDWPNFNAVVEYGSGTGALTSAIIPKLQPNAKFVAIEASKIFQADFCAKFPNVKLHIDSVANVAGICAQENIEHVDCIISGLPWAIFSKEEQNKFLKATLRVLAPAGVFTTFTYLQSLATPGERRFLTMLSQMFQSVEKVQLVWRNVPPAVVIRARNPK